MTVAVTLRRRGDEVTDGVIDLCSRLCAWAEAPAAWCGGRAAWQPLDAVSAAGAGGAALKLKGLGVAPGADAPARLPEDAPYDRWPGQAPDGHFAIAADLEFGLLGGDPAPLGGLTLEGALREFACAAALATRRVTAVRPVAVYEFAGRVLHHGPVARPLGVSITASPLDVPTRCSVALPGLGEDDSGQLELRRLARALGLRPANTTSAPARMDLLAAAYRGLGRTLRGFAEAGWYRYSGHPDNVAIDDAGEAVLVDLDSCRQVDPARCDLAALEAVRDGMSALYNLACSFFRPAVRGAVRDEELVAHEPFSAFLDGWDPQSAGTNAPAGRAIARYVVDSRVQLRRFEDFLAEPTAAGEQLYRYVRHDRDRDLTFSWLYRMAFARRLARPHGQRLPFGLDGLDDRLLRFAGRPRFERLADLVVAETAGAG